MVQRALEVQINLVLHVGFKIVIVVQLLTMSSGMFPLYVGGLTVYCNVFFIISF